MIQQSHLRATRSANRFLAAVFLTALLTGCASFKVDPGPKAQIQISNSGIGANLELRPSVLKIEPGETVAWNNLTNYHLEIQIEPDSAAPAPSPFISPFTTVEKKFEEAGTYSYTLIFSTEKNFGRITGTIIVGDPPSKRPLRRKQPPESPPEEKPSETEPFII